MAFLNLVLSLLLLGLRGAAMMVAYNLYLQNLGDGSFTVMMAWSSITFVAAVMYRPMHFTLGELLERVQSKPNDDDLRTKVQTTEVGTAILVFATEILVLYIIHACGIQ